MNYWEKLKSPAWQKKRLQIFERDDYTCQVCSSTDKELHVHHHYYKQNTDPWDYPPENYVTYCHECHEQETQLMQDVKQMIFQLSFLDDSCIEVYKTLQKMVIKAKREGYTIIENY